MHSFLIVSKNKKMAIEYALDLCKKNQIDKFDITLLSFEKAVGIEDVRNFQKQIILKPFKSKEKAVILDGTNGITIEAQNALLKLLEEPPQHTIIYVAVSNKALLLPTILSRCKIIELKDNAFELSKQESSQYLNILVSLPLSGVGDKLKLAQDIAKNKEEVVPWLEKMIIVAREALITQIMKSDKSNILPSSFWGTPLSGATPESPATMRDSGLAKIKGFQISSKYLNILISLQKTYTILKTTNVNPRIILENLFLNV